MEKEYEVVSTYANGKGKCISHPVNFRMANLLAKDRKDIGCKNLHIRIYAPSNEGEKRRKLMLKA